MPPPKAWRYSSSNSANAIGVYTHRIYNIRIILWSTSLRCRFLKQAVPVLLLIASALPLLSCGNDSASTETLTLVPDSYTIVVDTATGNVSGATQIQALVNGKAVDLSTIAWSMSSATVPPSCFGIDQTGAPHCNTGCGSSFGGTITATHSNSTTGATTTATASISCTFQ